MARKVIQLTDNDGNAVYPVVHGRGIPDGAVTGDKISDGAVTTEKVADKAVTGDKLDDGVSGSIDGSKAVADTLLAAFTEAKGDPYYLQDAFVRAGLVPIPFEDDVTKAACVELFDKDKDGEVSYAEALAVTSFSTSVLWGKLGAGFREARFFDNVTNLAGNSMRGNAGLARLELPSGVTGIGNWTFCGCKSVKTFRLPGVRTIGGNALRAMTSLTRLEMPAVETIEDWGIHDESLLGYILIGGNCTGIGILGDTAASGTMVCEASTPPTLKQIYYPNKMKGWKVYVPDESVEAYKEATNWSTLDILPMSEIPEE